MKCQQKVMEISCYSNVFIVIGCNMLSLQLYFFKYLKFTFKGNYECLEMS